MTERTLSIIKPDAVAGGKAGAILARLEKAGFRILAIRMVSMSKKQAEGFYAVHRARPFFGSLTDFMSSGPCIPLVLSGDNAVARYREIMGATDPKEAAAGTLRADFALDKEKNAVHGSDSPDNAAAEIAYFFTGCELAG